MAVRVKICGIRSFEEALAAVRAGADALGFVFATGRHRVDPEAAHAICSKLPPFVSRVGVFVNSPKYEVMEIATLCRLDTLQFHGDETPGFCRGFSQMVIKSFKVKQRLVLDFLKKYEVDAHLLDTYLPGQDGGTGRAFDWRLAEQASASIDNLILAGGLNPGNVAQAVEQTRPYAVDVSSGVEKDGVKDYQLISKLIAEVRRVEC